MRESPGSVDQEQAENLLGTRVSVDGQRATVLFKGRVGDTASEWLGVEWDDPGRGKHDGTHGGVRYFTPSHPGPTSSSFLRENKVEWGEDLVAGVRARYGRVEGETAGVEEEIMEDLQKEIGARFVQVVGFDKVNSRQSQIEKLRSVSLGDQRVTDRWVDLQSTLPSLLDLDLSENLVSSWSRLGKLLSQVPLRILNLSSNRLPVPEQMRVEDFSHLVHLVLGDIGYTWHQVERVAGDLPQLKHLQVHRNQIREIQVSPGKFVRLTELDLDGNQIEDWSSVRNLDTISGLEDLRLNSNLISEVRVTEELRSLRSLQICNNRLLGWDSVAQLNRLNLAELRLRKNPVLEVEKEEVCRLTIIALVNSLSTLNGSSITDTERKWAELDYYKKHGLEYLRILKLEEPERSESLERFLNSHGRYLDIVERLGVPEEAELKVKETNLKASLVAVKVRCPELPGSADTVKKLPLSMTVSKLKALVGRLYRSSTGGADLRLSLLSSKNQDQEQGLDNDLRELAYYSLESGDILLVRW